jgi:hypothetical protein
VIAIHLQSNLSVLGANWQGRKTPRFGPAPKGAGASNIPSVDTSSESSLGSGKRYDNPRLYMG